LNSAQDRVAVLRKLKEHLLSQRNKFREYLILLEQEEIDIEEGDYLKLKFHTDMEKDILSGLSAFQKVIDPLEEMYRTLHPKDETFREDEDLLTIRKTLHSLQTEVQKRNRRNRQLLSERMVELKAEILAIRRPVLGNTQFASPAPSLIDITT
jgi:arsenate reductase-like glutaredoxin family protein